MHRSILLVLALIASPLAAQTVDHITDNITATVYESENYIRHPRMEEEDRLRGGNPAYRPGLEIICDVDDVEIRFFEELVGRAPMEWDDLKAGAYRVRLERTGYRILEFMVQVRSDRRTVVFVEMGAALGTLSLKGLPPGARAYLDREPVEGTETDTPAGLHSLRVEAFGWESAAETVEISAGETLEWSYSGSLAAFEISGVKVRPKTLPPGDRRGFRIDWEATGPGTAAITVEDNGGGVVFKDTILISDYSGTLYWVPELSGDVSLPEGPYRVSVAGEAGIPSAPVEASISLDDRFIREPRPLSHLLPGLQYAAGTAMLPAGVWQASTWAGYDIGTGTSSGYTGVPAGLGFRIAPGRRWELNAGFAIRAVDPFADTGIAFKVSGSWRINPGSGFFSANLNLLYQHEGRASDFADIPAVAGPALPGLQLSVPMEFAVWDFAFILTPGINLFFAGDDPTDWYLAAPARVTSSLGGGFYWENGRALVGASTTVRTPDFSGSFLDWTLWSGAEGRFDLPGEASYFALWCGVRYLDIDPVIDLGIEFGIIR